MTHEPFTQDNSNPAEKFDTLDDLGMPVALRSLLPAKSRGLALISGTETAEVAKMMSALAHSFKEESRSVVFLRMDGGFALPGIPEMRASVQQYEEMIRARGLNHVLFLESVDTKAKLTLAINAAMLGRVVIAPVTSYSPELVIGSVIESGVNRFMFADVLRYIAQQTVLEDPFASSGETILDTYINVMDFKWKKLMWAYGR